VDPVCALDGSVVTSSREAQAEIKNVIAEKETAKIARRFMTRATNHQFRYLSNRSIGEHPTPRLNRRRLMCVVAAGNFHHDEGG
jgi:hypothetical protein